MALILVCTQVAPGVARAETDAEKALAAAKTERDTKLAEQKAVEARQAALANQKKAQEDTAKSNKSGGQMASLLGAGLMAGGAVMVTLALTEGPNTNWPLLAAGLFTIAGGVGSMMTAGAMGKTADKANQNIGNLDSLGSNFGGTGTSATRNSASENGFKSNAGSLVNPDGSLGNRSEGNSIAINADDLKNGKIGEIFDKFEASTGIKREDFARGLAEGKSPAELLAGIGGLSKEELENGMKNAVETKAGGLIGEGDIEKAANEMGLGDLYADAKSEGGVDFSGGGGASRATASGAANPLANILNASGSPSPTLLPDDSGKVDLANLSESVRKQLEKEGRTGQSLFQMVTLRYRKVTPMLFGEEIAIGLYDEKKAKNDILLGDESLSR